MNTGNTFLAFSYRKQIGKREYCKISKTYFYSFIVLIGFKTFYFKEKI